MSNNKHEYIIENKYGDLILKRLFRDKNNRLCAYAVCDICGRDKNLRATDLFRKENTSCMCKIIKHGMDSTKIYSIYHNMKYRCYNDSCKAYKNYGGRGIKICEEWLNSFESFYKWSIENNYIEGLSIDRINNDGNYEPNNCQWITKSENTAKANRENPKIKKK